MNFDFLLTFQPKVTDVGERGIPFWQFRNYMLERDQTKKHNLVLVHEGRGSFEIDGRHCTLRRGSLLYIPRGSCMRLIASKAQPLLFYSLFFVYGQLHWEDECAYWTERDEHPLPLDRFIATDSNPQMIESFVNILNWWNHKHVGYELHCRNELLRIMEAIKKTAEAASPRAQHTAQWVDSTIVYIREHLQDNLTRDVLAARLYLTPPHFAAVFKKHVGVSLTQFIANMRLETSAKLLVETSLSVRDISAEVGYSDSFYFTRSFTKKYGVPPQRFRKL